MMPEPLYTSRNCSAAYQLNWSLTLFWRNPPGHADWLEELKPLAEGDSVRILEHRLTAPETSQFLLSTAPQVAPSAMVRSIKGRLQHLLRTRFPATRSASASPLQRNFAVRSVGAVARNIVDQYVASQLRHHPLADERVTARLDALRIFAPTVDLGKACTAAHAQYWYNLHLVLVRAGRFREIEQNHLVRMRDDILGTAQKHRHKLSHGAILPDHFYLVLRACPEQSPEEVALSYLNNLAYAAGQNAIFESGYYAGTFGEYSRGAIASDRGEDPSLHRDKPGGGETGYDPAS